MDSKTIIEIPKGVTNGEVIKQMFDKYDYDYLRADLVYTEWWNRKYEKKRSNPIKPKFYLNRKEKAYEI